MRRKKTGRKARKKEPLTRGVKIRLLIFAVLALCFLIPTLIRSDALYFIHFWMPILWTPVLVLPFVTFRPRPLIIPGLACFALWFVAVLGLGEPGFGHLVPSMPKADGVLRVVVLNCAGGDTSAIKEALAVEGADLWLLQETTGPRGMRQVLDQVDPSMQVVADYDACIVARKGLSATPKAGNSAAADFHWKGQTFRVVSLRLIPPVFRLDWWNPDTHRAYQQDMRDRRDQMHEILAGSKVLDAPLGVVAGDFNSTNRPVFGAMMPGWHEADQLAGRGWPGTGTNDYPLARVDHLWTSRKLWPVQSFVRRTTHSDHRMIITDLKPFDLAKVLGL